MFSNATYSWKAFYSNVPLDPNWFSGTEPYWIVGFLFLIKFALYKQCKAEKQTRTERILFREREENTRRSLTTGELDRRQNPTRAECPLLSSPQAKASLDSPALGGPSRKTPPCPPGGTGHRGPPSSSAAAHHHPGPPPPERPRHPKTNGCVFKATSELDKILPCPAPDPAAQRPPRALPLEVDDSDSLLGEVDFQDLRYPRIPLSESSELSKPPGGLKVLFCKARAAFRRFKCRAPSAGYFQRGQDGPGPNASNTPSQPCSYKKIRKCLALSCSW